MNHYDNDVARQFDSPAQLRADCSIYGPPYVDTYKLFKFSDAIECELVLNLPSRNKCRYEITVE